MAAVKLDGSRADSGQPAEPGCAQSLLWQELAQRYCCPLWYLDGPNEESGDGMEAVVDCQEVDVAALELVQPRSIGVEHAGPAAREVLQLPRILRNVGLNVRCIGGTVAIGSLNGRMAEPRQRTGHLRWLA